MNKARRKQLDALQQKVLECQQEAEAIRDAEQDAFDNLPESLQQGPRGVAMEEAIGVCESVIDSLDNAYAELGVTL